MWSVADFEEEGRGHDSGNVEKAALKPGSQGNGFYPQRPMGKNWPLSLPCSSSPLQPKAQLSSKEMGNPNVRLDWIFSVWPMKWFVSTQEGPICSVFPEGEADEMASKGFLMDTPEPYVHYLWWNSISPSVDNPRTESLKERQISRQWKMIKKVRIKILRINGLIKCDFKK